ncbi:MAG: DNA-protecting protein DprA [Candidatus Baltobacteraceae bacterium]
MNQVRFITLRELENIRGPRDCALRDGLWAQGALDGLARPTVALVGTRAATAYGRRTAHAFAAELGRAGCCVISGLALGIDTAAHEGALAAGAGTVGVLGSGHAHFFPARNVELARRIVANGGAILSPFPPEQPALPWQFLQRNGVVAALADAVVVIEAPARSGALNTANWAADRIPVFAVPGDIDRAHVAGCHALIRDGATLARSAADVLEVLRMKPLPESPDREEERPADEVSGQILHTLASGEAGLETLAEMTGYGTPQLISALGVLEIAGLVVRSGAFFARARPSVIVEGCNFG